MIFVIIGLIGGAIVGWKMVGPERIIGHLLGALVALGIGTIGVAIGGIVAMGVGALLPMEYVMENQIELAALKDVNSPSGDFFLGCGIFEGKLYYVFYKKEKDGALIPGKILADDNKVKIYEEEREDGLMEVFEKDLIKKFHYLFGFPSGVTRYKIYVPKGSVSRKFELDLE